MREIVSESGSANSGAIQSLRLIKFVLLIFTIGICFVGKTKATWPIVGWTLYSGYSARFRPPEPAVSITELRVRTRSGELLVVKPEQILSLPRDSLSHKIVEQAFNNTDSEERIESRKYLLNAISSYINSESQIETVQAWQLTYQIDPLTVPPIQRQDPNTEVMLGDFAAQDYLASDRE